MAGVIKLGKQQNGQKLQFRTFVIMITHRKLINFEEKN
jgi:hypothetical protein